MALTDIVLIIAVIFATIGLVRSFNFDRTLYDSWKSEVARLHKLSEVETLRRKEETNLLSIEIERERFLRRSLEDSYDVCRRSMAAFIGDDTVLQKHESPLATREDRDAAVAVLSNYYNMDELEELMFSIGVSIDNIKHDTLNMAVREFVWYMERHNRFNELVAVIHKTRPTL